MACDDSQEVQLSPPYRGSRLNPDFEMERFGMSLDFVGNERKRGS